MDRQIVYVGQIPLDTDQLKQNKNAMIGLGMALQAILGTTTLFDGLACTPTGPASLQVLVAPGSVYSFQNVDGTAYGSLASDTSHQIVKQGINIGTLTLSCPAPGTTGQSINYLIQSAYQDADTGSTVLPYYNSSNPAVAYNGPGNSGVSQNTVRQGQCLVAVKAGVAATTGSQVTPAPDAGYTGLWVVTVANGQTTITSGNISLASGAPFISEKLKDKVSIPTGDARWMPIGGGTSRTKLTANTNYYVTTAGNDSTGTGLIGAPWLTIQHAVNYINSSIDLCGFTATINVGNGTYSAGALISGAFVGAGTVRILGNTTTPASCLIDLGSTVGTAFINSTLFSVVNVAGFKVTGTGSGTVALNAALGGKIFVDGAMEYGAIPLAHINAQDVASSIHLQALYTISGGGAAHIQANNGAEIQYGAVYTVTLSGTPAFSTAFANTTAIGMIVNLNNATFSGSATGPRYSAITNSVINTAGSGASFLPGSSAGSTATGGQYV